MTSSNCCVLKNSLCLILTSVAKWLCLFARRKSCQLTHCTPDIARIFAKQLVIDVFLTPEEIAAERDKLEQQKRDKVRCARFKALLIFVQHTDEIVDIIRFSNGPREICRLLLMQYGLSEYQALYILDIEIGQIRYLRQEEIERKYRYYYEKVKAYQQ